jgi:predicted PurR-regulated permease PerM
MARVSQQTGPADTLSRRQTAGSGPIRRKENCMHRWASFIVLIAFILLIGALFFRILASFFVPLFLAVILVVIFRPLHRELLERWKDHPKLAALATTLAAMLVVIVPSLLVVTLAVVESVSLFSQARFREAPVRLRQLRATLQLELPAEPQVRRADAIIAQLSTTADEGTAPDDGLVHDAVETLRQLRSELVGTPHEKTTATLDEAVKDLQSIPNEFTSYDKISTVLDATRTYQQFRTDLCGGPIRRAMIDWTHPSPSERRALLERLMTAGQRYLLPIGGTTIVTFLKLLAGVAIAGIAMYFFLVDGSSMLETMMRLSPLDDKYERELVAEFERVSRAVVLASLVSAAVQAVLAGIGFWLAGLASVFLLILLTALFALIPFVGAAAVWFPASVWLFIVEERTTAALALALYGALIVSLSDNLVKPMVLHGQSRLHPLWALLSVLGGVQVLGPVGILVGPMVVVCLQALLSILQRELTQLDRRRKTQTT